MGKAPLDPLANHEFPYRTWPSIGGQFSLFSEPVGGAHRQDPFIACSTLAGAGGSSIFRVPGGEVQSYIKTRRTGI